MCQLWLAMNKSIVFLPAHRYNLGRCTADDWRQLDRDVLHLAGGSTGAGGSTVATMSRYDAEYLRYYTGIKQVLLTSFSGYYMNPDLYKPSKDQYLIVGTGLFVQVWLLLNFFLSVTNIQGQNKLVPFNLAHFFGLV
jgi:hypothetical protein